MKICAVVACGAAATVIVGKPTEWGAWEYWVCDAHRSQVSSGAEIDDQPDGRSIVLS